MKCRGLRHIKIVIKNKITRFWSFLTHYTRGETNGLALSPKPQQILVSEYGLSIVNFLPVDKCGSLSSEANNLSWYNTRLP